MNRPLTTWSPLIVLLISSNAFAAGFEKATIWSGRYAPIGGAASSIVNDAEATFFNPAGLAAMQPGWSTSLNFSPTFTKANAPIATDATVEGETQFSPIYGAYLAYRMDNGLGVGIGSGVAGGTKGKFENVAFSGFTLTPDYETSINILEHTLAVGYEPIEGLRFGAGWRVLQVFGDYETASQVTAGANTVLLNVRYNDFSATRWNGFRLGMQYAPRDAGWGVGLVFRNNVEFEGESDSVTAQAETSAAVGTLIDATSGSGSLTTNFPLQFSVGGFKGLGENDARKILVEYTFTRYSVNAQVAGQNTVAFAGALGTAVNSSVNGAGVDLNWRNQHNVRVGYDYTPADGFAYRAGYVLTSKVTREDYSRPGLAPPGFGHSFLLGGGYNLSQNLAINAGLEYAFNQADGSSAPDISPAVSGSYKVTAFAAHLGTTIRF